MQHATRRVFLCGIALVACVTSASCRGAETRVYDDEIVLVDGGPNGVDPNGSPDADVKPAGEGEDAGNVGPLAPSKIGGTVTGLIGSGLLLQNNGGDDLPIETSGAFMFPVAVAPGAPYDVTVKTPPSAPTQTCTVSNGQGIASGADVTNVLVSCLTNTYKIGGTVTGLLGSGLVLRNNGGNDLAVTADGGFTFATPVGSGANYNVTIQTQPTNPAQTCSVSGGEGTVVAADVTSVVVNCGTNTYTVGGTVSGLAGTVVLQNNGSDDRVLTANGSFAFSKPIASGNPFSVTVKSQPAYPPSKQTCTVSNASGTMGSANVTNVSVTCTTNMYTIGGTVTGLTGSLVLQNNGGNNRTISNDGPFTFSSAIASGSSYAVTILTPPAGQTCQVTNGSGTVTSSNVTNVGVTCNTPIVLSENFDGVTAPALPSGWTSTVTQGGSSGANPWRTRTNYYSSAPNSAWVDDHSDSSNINLDSPAFTVTTSTAKLTFKHRFGFESGYDGGVLEISIGGGSFQDILSAGGSFVSGGYNRSSIDGLNGRRGWSGNSNGWTTVVVNLPASAAGKSVKLRWRAGSDESYGDAGWWIDDVLVEN
jgi:hypothetical protein